MKETVEYFKGDELASQVYLSKYAAKDDNGNPIEPYPNQRLSKIAEELARIEKKYLNPLSRKDIEDMLFDFKYIVLGGSAMASLGLNKPVSNSNCFVIASPNDSIDSIYDSRKDQAQLMKRRKNLHCVAA